MGMIAGNEQEKSQLATEICELSARATACAVLHHPRTNKSPFVNWYLLLKVCLFLLLLIYFLCCSFLFFGVSLTLAFGGIGP